MEDPKENAVPTGVAENSIKLPKQEPAKPPQAPRIFEVSKDNKKQEAKKEDWKRETENQEPSTDRNEVTDMQSYIKEVAYWEQPLLSAKVFLVLCWVYYSTLSGGYSLIGLFCYVLTVRLVAVAGPRMAATELAKFENSIAKKAASACNKAAETIECTLKLPSADQVTFVVRGAADIVEKKTFAAAEAIEKAGKDTKMLKIVLGYLLGIMFLNRMVCLWNLVFFGLFIGMTAPAIYHRQQARIDPIINKAKNKVQPYVEKVEQKSNEIIQHSKSKASEAVTKVVNKYKEFRERGKKAPEQGEEQKKEQ